MSGELTKRTYLSQVNINADGTMVGKFTTDIFEDGVKISTTAYREIINVADGVTPTSPEVTPIVQQMLDSVFYLRSLLPETAPEGE